MIQGLGHGIGLAVHDPAQYYSAEWCCEAIYNSQRSTKKTQTAITAVTDITIVRRRCLASATRFARASERSSWVTPGLAPGLKITSHPSLMEFECHATGAGCQTRNVTAWAGQWSSERRAP
jgi:hypothetical protein